MNNDETYSFDISLVVVSEKSIDEVVNILKFEEFSLIHKGDRMSRVLSPAEENIYSYTQKCDSVSEYQTSLLRFLNTLLEKKKELVFLKTKYDVYVKIFYQSDYAQMQFELPTEFFQIMHKLDLKCKVSLLSWGEA